MIAKINRGKNLMGALYYNYHKVEKEKAQVLFTQKMIEAPDGSYSVSQLANSFELYLLANRKTEKPVLHISINPDPKDTVSDADFNNIAQDYMKQMGYEQQPFVVFKHTDINRTHIHIVSICVDEQGRKISDQFEKRRSMVICRSLEKEYNLISAIEKKENLQHFTFTPVDYKSGDIKSQMASVLRYLPKYYKFQSFGGYNALLSRLNITVEEVKGEYNGITKQGLVYFALNDKGEKISNPFKASLFGKSAGYTHLQSYYEKSKIILKDHPNKASLKATIEKNMHATTNEITFINRLQQQGIDTVIRRSKEGRIYGITFIDHSSKTIWNGSQFGKNLSANFFEEYWNKDDRLQYSSHENMSNSKRDQSEKIDIGQAQELFNFLDKENIQNDSLENGLIDALGGLFSSHQGEDYDEEAFAKMIKKKTKQRKR